MPCWSAQAPAGDRSSWRPRPDGASGRVSSATSSCSEARIASSAGSATAGVPAKTRRMSPTQAEWGGTAPRRRVRGDLHDGARGVVPLGLADLAQGVLARGRVEAIDEYHTV